MVKLGVLAMITTQMLAPANSSSELGVEAASSTGPPDENKQAALSNSLPYRFKGKLVATPENTPLYLFVTKLEFVLRPCPCPSTGLGPA